MPRYYGIRCRSRPPRFGRDGVNDFRILALGLGGASSARQDIHYISSPDYHNLHLSHQKFQYPKRRRKGKVHLRSRKVNIYATLCAPSELLPRTPLACPSLLTISLA